jgi:cell division protein FtsB
MSVSLPRSRRALRRWLIGGALGVGFVWICFFDSHSLLRRYQWHQEHDALTKENQQLRQKIDRLQEKLDEPLSDETVERIAREEYGMKRAGETVYRVQPE